MNYNNEGGCQQQVAQHFILERIHSKLADANHNIPSPLYRHNRLSQMKECSGTAGALSTAVCSNTPLNHVPSKPS